MIDDGERFLLKTLAKRYPNVDAVLAELSNLEAVLTLPRPRVHIVSDVHGEHVKLRQVIANASGSLRPLVERVSKDPDLLALIYRPRETWLRVSPGADRRVLLQRFVPPLIAVMRTLASRYTLKWVDKIIPDPFDTAVREMLFAPELKRSADYIDGLVAPFLRHDRDLDLVRMLSHVIRNLAVAELVVAGDLGDRGPRIDKVIELLQAQPHLAIAFGNHDADWMAACLGHPAAIATVVRLSLRYQRLEQLEEGYGISLEPLRELARDAYGNDPAECFATKGDSTPELARMQKAAVILQLKLEGQLFQRRTEWNLTHRALLHRIDPAAGTIVLDGKMHPLRDTRFPTVDWADPYKLSPAEQACFDSLQRSFLDSYLLWQHMQFIASKGRMWLRRDRCAIFHGCIPVDERGEFLPMTIDGAPRAGRAMFEAFDVVVHRAFRTRAIDDVDLVFYLWTGPLSPCFGKDKMATFETYFLADKATQEETKNPYFKLLDDAAFCAKVLREFGVDPERGYIVNGHVPVKLEKGETPVKKSGRAITIDGAFAAAYGDKGFSLVLGADRIYLAQHHHLDEGGDIVPTVSDVEVYDRPRLVAETEAGEELRAEIAALEQLVTAFETNAI
ncbi:MAG: fructose-bisphosphatase class III [Deltaproteobacteria bacterium]|nr:fructose-bisphosphatase class III [Deltaproteobacteria bacterium]